MRLLSNALAKASARVLLCAFLLGQFPSATAAPTVSEDGLYTYDNDIVIPTPLDPFDPDNTEEINLPANIHVPITNDPQQTFPLIVFVNSWTLNEFQYGVQARAFARKGYITLSYTTRGFQKAPGLVDTAGPKDIVDLRRALDWAIEHYPVDENAIGLAGISYGSGIVLITAMQDERVKAVVPMSTWGSMVESLWAGQTPNYTWIQLLVGSGSIMGKLDPIVKENYRNMRLHQNVGPTIDWGNLRSPIHYIELANNRQNKPAIYVSNNLHDYLFQPNSIIEFLERYQGEWRLDLNYGTHGQGEAAGLSESGGHNYPWRNAHAWFDHYLKGIDNGIDRLKKVNTFVKSRSFKLVSNRESFDNLPVADPNDQLVLHLSSNGNHMGRLSPQPFNGYQELSFDTTDSTINAGNIMGAINASDRHWKLDDIDLNHATVFVSEPLENGLYLRGEAVVNFYAEVQNSTQYFGYLLDLDPNSGDAYFIGHAPLTWHRPDGDTVDPNHPVQLELEFYWTAHDVNPGNQLVLVIDGEDPDYWRYEDEIATPEENTLILSTQYPATLSLPRIREPVAFQSLEDPTGEQSSPDRQSNGTDEVYGPTGGSINLWYLVLMVILTSLRTFTLQRLNLTGHVSLRIFQMTNTKRYYKFR